MSIPATDREKWHLYTATSPMGSKFRYFLRGDHKAKLAAIVRDESFWAEAEYHGQVLPPHTILNHPHANETGYLVELCP